MLNACSQYSYITTHNRQSFVNYLEVIVCLYVKHTIITETLSIQAKFPQALSCDINFLLQHWHAHK